MYIEEDKCKCCGHKYNAEFDDDELEYGLCVKCREEFENDIDLMLAYADRHQKEFYLEYCYGVFEDCYPELLPLCRREIKRDIGLQKPYALDLLRNFCKEDVSHYYDFCINQTKGK